MTKLYQDPEPQDPELTPQVLKARQVLEALDEMRTSGASTQAQFEFLRRHIPEDHEMDDDRTPIEVRLERQEESKAGFRRLQEAMTNVIATWEGSTVLPSEPKDIGRRLLGILDEMRRQVETDVSQHWKSEIEMLAEIWPSDPDVSDIFQCRPVIPPELRSKKIEVVKEAAPRAGESRAEEVDVDLDEDCKELEKKALELHEQFIKEAAIKASAEKANGEADEEFRVEAQELDKKWRRETRELDSQPFRRFAIKKDTPEPGDKVVGSVHAPAAPKAEKTEGPNHLRRDAWAEALREMTARPWKFDRELHGRTGDQGLEGDVLHFTAPATEILSARLTIIPMPKGKQQVALHLQMDSDSYHLAETLVEDEAEKLHLDPIPFVKKTLER